MAAEETLPNDLAACHALIREQDETNRSLAKDLEAAKVEIEQLKRYIYGRRSERHVDDASQLSLFAGDAEPPKSADSDNDDSLLEEIRYRRRKRNKADRFPEHLPRQVLVKDVEEGERNCPCCGEEMPVIASEVRTRLDFVPAKLLVHETHYRKRACGKCKETVKVAPPPTSDEDAASPTSGSRYGFGVTTQIVLGKYADHLPLYRMEDIFARAGVVIPRSTQVGLLDAAADLLLPLDELIRRRLCSSDILGLDDTPVRLQDASLPGQMRTARMWLARGREAAPYNAFFFTTSRERAGPAKFLADFRGWVTVDAYGVQDGVYLGAIDRITASCCHAHVRRKFEAAKSNDPQRASRALAFYRRLFEIEDRGLSLGAEERSQLREREARPLLESFRDWLESQVLDAAVLPKSAIGKAVRYALNQWVPLTAFLQEGRLPIHNNDTERDLRRLTIGRANWLFIGSEAAGEVAARMYTVVASAARHNLDLWAYLDDVLRRLAGGAEDLGSLLPDRWAAEHPESIRVYRQLEQLERASRTQARRARRRKLAAG